MQLLLMIVKDNQVMAIGYNKLMVNDSKMMHFCDRYMHAFLCVKLHSYQDKSLAPIGHGGGWSLMESTPCTGMA